MPWKIKKIGDKYCVAKKSTGKCTGSKRYSSKSAATPYLRALYANENINEMDLKTKLGKFAAKRMGKPGGFLSRQAEIISATDPQRIRIDDIAKFFHIPNSVAKFLLNLAVREGVFTKNDDGTYASPSNQESNVANENVNETEAPHIKAGTQDIENMSADQLAQAAYDQYERGGRGGETLTHKGKGFGDWLVENPIGRWYAVKIVKKSLQATSDPELHSHAMGLIKRFSDNVQKRGSVIKENSLSKIVKDYKSGELSYEEAAQAASDEGYSDSEFEQKLEDLKENFNTVTESVINYFDNPLQKEGYWYEIQNPRFEYRGNNKNKQIIALPPKYLTGRLLESKGNRFIRIENKISKIHLEQYGLKPLNEFNFHNHIGFDRKPQSLDEVHRHVDFNHLSLEIKDYIRKLPVELVSGIEGERIYKLRLDPAVSTHYVIKYGREYFLVDTQGFDYPRYITHLVGYTPNQATTNDQKV